MKKQASIIAIVILCLIAILAAVWYFMMPKEEAATHNNLGTITIGIDKWPGILPYLIAIDNGYFSRLGLKVKTSEIDDNSLMVRALSEGKIDFSGDLTLVDVIKERFAGDNLQVVGVTDYSNGGDGIVVRKSIKSIGGLKGKKIAVEKGSLSEKMLYFILEKNNLSLADVKEVNVLTSDSAQLFIDGKVDAVVTYEPYLSMAVEQGNGTKIFSTASAPGLIIDIAAMRQEYIDSHQPVVTALLTGYFQGLDFIKSQPDAAYAIGVKYFGVSPQEVANYFSGLKSADLRDNVSAMAYAAGYQSLYGNGQFANRFLKDTKIIDKSVDLNDIIRPEFVRKIEAGQ